MTSLGASTSYKKVNGTVTVTKDRQVISWAPTAPPGSKPVVILTVPTITNLQATPATSPKVMLKVFVKPDGVDKAIDYVFTFTNPVSARNDLDAIKEVLSIAIQAHQSGSSILPAAGGTDGGGTSAAMAIASAVSSRPTATEDADAALYDDARLIGNGDLQKSIFKSNAALQKTFMELIRTKPESITMSQFSAQFWSSRVHLLRAHAIEQSQQRGSYNVLSTIKPKTVDGALKLSVSKEQIQLIFNQYSLVKRVYDECVPKLSESEFWARFFQSRLFKKLKGEKISEQDSTDAILDKYLHIDDDDERNRRILASHIPHIIDIEGNEENHSQRKGNQPDFTMRPNASNKVPIIRTLNSLSEKIMSHVPPSDIDPSMPIGMDEGTFNELRLQDLQSEVADQRIMLNMKDPSSFGSAAQTNGVSADALLYAQQDPDEVLDSVRSDLASTGTDMDLGKTIGVDEDSSDEEDGRDGPPARRHVGSKASIRVALSQILAGVAQERAQSDDHSFSSSTFSTAEAAVRLGLSPLIYERLTLTHATSTEFLQHFWHAFFSGDSSRADEVARLVETLDRAMDRIKAVADEAEKEREKEINKLKAHVRERYEKTGKKLRIDPSSVKGGAMVVNQLLGPTVIAIGAATERYKSALAEETALESGG
ncbi:RNA polymerase II transcription factor B subunit 1 [Agyrium rufum]|nr:RNA polymerase II transcription factor B subunit 1 [Agyrium rufum]